jgi:hypothetical protein
MTSKQLEWLCYQHAMTPGNVAGYVLPNGVVVVVCDGHNVANVASKDKALERFPGLVIFPKVERQ